MTSGLWSKQFASVFGCSQLGVSFRPCSHWNESCLTAVSKVGQWEHVVATTQGSLGEQWNCWDLEDKRERISKKTNWPGLNLHGRILGKELSTVNVYTLLHLRGSIYKKESYFKKWMSTV